MLWLVLKNASHNIISCNTFKEGDKHQLWVTRPNGKNLMILESTDENEITTAKNAIDYAIEQKETALRLA